MEKLKKIFALLLQTRTVQYGIRLHTNIEEDYVGLLAAGIAFYFFMAAFPAIGAVISMYGLFSDPLFISEQIDNLSHLMPPDSLKILADQARAIATTSDAALGVGVIVGLLLAIYSATKGVGALIKGLNIAFNEKEKRNIIVLNLTAFILTFILMAYMMFSLSLIAVMPAFLNIIHIPGYIADPLLMLRWPLLFASAVVAVQIVYYYAPSHTKPHWQWFSWGALVSTLLWLGGSALFSMFVSNFGEYNETYGSLGAVAVLLLWFWLSAMTVLIGAEINASFEHPHSAKNPKSDIHFDHNA